MNSKFEEKLAQLAFGDLSPEEAARIEAQVKNDPEALHALNMYHGMRAGLSGLKDIPADQMSKERLRDAILAQGLKPKATPKFGWGWLWMPAMASVLAVGIMLLPRGGAVDQPMVNLGPNPLGDMRVAMKDPVSNPINFDSRTNEPSFTSRPTEEIVEVPVAGKQHRRAYATGSSRGLEHPRTISITEAEKVAIESEAWSDLVASIDTPGGDTARDSNPPRHEEPIMTASTPIVIIEENVDESTGAMAASEVGANNVLIGG